MPRLTWDIFCEVIDNHGDLGVCWRLACQVAEHGDAVRLWVDDPAALSWMAAGGASGVELRNWGGLIGTHESPTDILIEAFGCSIPTDFVQACADRVQTGAQTPVWINLEYLSAEAWVARNHGLSSPIWQGPTAGWSKWFFYPGFTGDTGGLLRETNLLPRQQAFDTMVWRAQQPDSAAHTAARWVSLFCYEPPALADWLDQCATARTHATRLLVTPGRAHAAVQCAVKTNFEENGSKRLPFMGSSLSILNIEHRSQMRYDELLWACDLNFVRGEDSLVRALWAGKPFVWHIYPQEDGAHGPKLQAFLDWLQAPPSLRQFHAVWNGLAAGRLPVADADTLKSWSDCVQRARAGLLQQTDLLTQLLRFCASKR